MKYNNERLTVDMNTVEMKAKKNVMSLTILAMKAGISPATIFALKSGRRNPSMRTIRKLATALGVDPQELIKK